MNTSQILTRALKLKYPVVQAPMAGVGTPELATAVSNEGGLGSIAVGASTPEVARKMVADMKNRTSASFAVNFFCHRPANLDPSVNKTWLSFLEPTFSEFQTEPPKSLSEIYQTFVENSRFLEILLGSPPQAVSFHFGVPSANFVEKLHKAGIYTMATATSLEEAQAIESVGINAIVAQGYEAGGHRGIFDPGKEDLAIGTLALVRMIVTRTKLPVIAAGGIMDGAGISAAMKLGAAGVQLGTAFILCPESSASQEYRSQLKSERSHKTGITKNISGRPARGIINRFHTLRDTSKTMPTVPDYPIAYDAGKALNTASQRLGNFEFAPHWAGQGAPLAREMPAADLFRTLIAEWKAAEANSLG
jgi:nitronate monooxygenase